jgi:hypothetical protein
MARSTAATTLLFFAALGAAAQMPVKHQVGAIRGFLTIRAQGSGTRLGYGEFSATAVGDRVTAHMVYHFFNGSLDDDTTVFLQRKNFEFVSDHHIQRGRFFPKPSDITIDANGDITTRTPDKGGKDKDGKEKVDTSHIDIPPDLSNGMVGTILQNVASDSGGFKLGMIVYAGKPRAIHLDVTSAGTQTFHIAGVTRKATVFRLKPEIGGAAGVIAPIIGKQPPDILISVLEGDPPVILRIVQQLAQDTPTLDIQLAGTTFPKNSTPSK